MKTQIQPKHSHIFCIDSDGCAMNTMTIKHQKFFGPLIIKYFHINDQEKFLTYWNKLNLYFKTRGINRFVGLVTALKAFNYPNISNLEEWVNTTKEYSTQSLKKAIAQYQSTDLKNALAWSNAVNQRIAAESTTFKPFKAAVTAIQKLATDADIAIVSSANKQAILSEWKRNHLLENVEIIFGQEDGKKADCLEKLSQFYSKQSIMMIGDAIGDYQAAQKAQTLFYPILVNHENESWELLYKKVVAEFLANNYDQQKYYDKFMQNFDELKRQ